jgi:hypothetical protein
VWIESTRPDGPALVQLRDSQTAIALSSVLLRGQVADELHSEEAGALYIVHLVREIHRATIKISIRQAYQGTLHGSPVCLGSSVGTFQHQCGASEEAFSPFCRFFQAVSSYELLWTHRVDCPAIPAFSFRLP